MKKLRYLLEAAILWLAFQIFRALTPEKSSDIGGWIGRTVGPRLGASKKALGNIRHAFPEKSDKEQRQIAKEMWDNLGRIVAEYPHMHRLVVEYMDIAGEEYIYANGREHPAIFISGHFANWELMATFFNSRIKWPMVSLYREPNNPYVARIMARCRNPDGHNTYIAKSANGMRSLVQALRDGKHIGMLIDQKYNQGIPAMFLGRYAMSSTAFAQMSRKYACPVVPIKLERTGSCRFRITFHPPLDVQNLSNEEAVAKNHALLESWIRENPGQWLWLHRRWDSKAVREMNAAL